MGVCVFVYTWYLNYLCYFQCESVGIILTCFITYFMGHIVIGCLMIYKLDLNVINIKKKMFPQH